MLVVRVLDFDDAIWFEPAGRRDDKLRAVDALGAKRAHPVLGADRVDAGEPQRDAAWRLRQGLDAGFDTRAALRQPAHFRQHGDAVAAARRRFERDQLPWFVTCAGAFARQARATIALVQHAPLLDLAPRFSQQMITARVAAALKHMHLVRAQAVERTVLVIPGVGLTGDHAEHGIEIAAAVSQGDGIFRSAWGCPRCCSRIDDRRRARVAAAVVFLTPGTVKTRQQGAGAGMVERRRQAHPGKMLPQAQQMDPFAQAARQRRDIQKIDLPAAVDDADLLFGRIRRRRQVSAGERARQPRGQPSGGHLAFPLRRQIKCTVTLAACRSAANQAEQQRAVLGRGDADKTFRMQAVRRRPVKHALRARKAGVTRHRLLDRCIRRLAGAQRAHQACASEVSRARQAQGQAWLQVCRAGSSGARNLPVGFLALFPERQRMLKRDALGRPQRQRLAGVALRVLRAGLDPQCAHRLQNFQPACGFEPAVVKLGDQGFECVMRGARIGDRQAFDPLFGVACIADARPLA